MNKSYNENKIISWIIILPILGVVLTSFILTNIFISSKYELHNTAIQELKSNHIYNLKEKIKERIEYLSKLLENNYNREVEKSKNSVKDIVDVGHTTIQNIYAENKHLSKTEIFKLINERMKDLRFFENKSGYYFIYDLKDGISISLPSAPSLVGSSVKNLIDKNGKNLFMSYGNILDTKGEGFDTWYWNKPNSKKKLKKIGYIKKFKPLNIAIGTAVYTEDIKKAISSNILEFVESLQFKDNSYIFINHINGTVLSHKNKAIINKTLPELNKKSQENIRKFVAKATNSNGDFITYTQAKEILKNSNSSQKISYVKHIKILNWVIGTGLYTDELEKQIEKKNQKLEEKLENDISTILFASFFVTLIIIVALVLLSKKLKSIFQFYSFSIDKSNKELKNLNTQLERKVEVQVSNLREKDIILNQQSKLAAMGEMLGNIAHQWRQPLSAISTLASGIRVQKEFGTISEAQLDKDLLGIVESTKTLSDTIDDFRNFYSKEKTVEEFEINEAFEKVLNLISANLKHKDIKLIIDIENIKIKSYINELVQVLLNIINNAKDALEEFKYKRYIFINSYKKESKVYIEIYDNAGGIDSDILNRIFEPYFTTKFKAHGTGIGLYMTKNIVDNSLLGQIEVKNKEFIYDDEHFKGALFIIELPLNVSFT